MAVQILLGLALVVSNVLWFHRMKELHQERKKMATTFYGENLSELLKAFADLGHGGGIIKIERVDPKSVMLIPPYGAL